ncbi:MAG TPA: type II toxin-antitoxin system prevent-host-death family antitoxin [Miltoncostaeaceae bacterium]|nr:type II toxin-antitoxin system prevent-host-death family antitoxin [Miltoncostaeaceae bacterium]
MPNITVTELNQRTKAVLDRVRAGERLVITDRGRPIAQIVPSEPTHWDRLVASGRVRKATYTGPVDIAPIPLGTPTHQIIDDLRADRA